MIKVTLEFRHMSHELKVMDENEEEKSKVELSSKVRYKDVKDMNANEIESEKLKQRRMVNFNCKDTLWVLFWWNKWRFKRHKRLEMNIRNKLYNQGVEKLSNELDWVSIINSIRELNVLVQLIIDENQRELIKFHKDNLLIVHDNNDIYLKTNYKAQ